MKRLARIRADESGLSLVEFGLLAPVMILMITGFLEIGYVAYARSTLESATLEAARFAMATDCPDEREETMRIMIADRMSIISSADGQGPNIVVKSYAGKFGDVGTPEPFTDNVTVNSKWDTGEPFTDVNGNGKWDADMGKDGSLGAAGDVVTYETSYKVASLMPFLAKTMSRGLGYYPINAATVTRNEPVFRNRCT
jgi:Flp pilus assembly protein TadG